jgi:putative oxidoreductase
MATTVGEINSHHMKILQNLLKTDNAVSTLPLRLTLGAVFFPHGAQKVLAWFGGYGFTGTMGFFTGTLHIPALFAFLAIAAEFAGSLALLIGLGTRIAALGIASTMAVAMALVHAQFGFFMNWAGAQKGEGYEYHLLAIGIALALILRGGGKWSVDAAICRTLDERS